MLSACTGPSGGVQVQPGIEVLLADSLELLAGKRVGVLTNQTGIDHEGTGDIKVLLQAGVQVTAIFSPEHGFTGTLDREGIAHGTDSTTGIPIYSLYGDTRAPTPGMLETLDLLLIDLFDIGTRTYTYASTALLAIEAASDAGIPVLVLDRPNPLGGIQVQGPVLADTLESFIGMLAVPTRHGLTLGELALIGRDARGLRGTVHVIRARGWRREMWFDATGLPWVRPSPNMPDLESATHYPGLVVFESTNLSVGRGTPIAFQVIGAPWLDPGRVLGLVGAQPGVSLSDTVFTPEAPSDGKYAGLELRGIRLRVVDRGAYDPVRTGLRLLWAIHRVQGDMLEVKRPGLDRRIGTQDVFDAIVAGRDFQAIYRPVLAAARRFRERREPFLLYR